MRTKIKLPLACAGAILLFIAAVILFLHSSPARRYVLNRSRDYFHQSMGIDLKAGGIQYNLLNLSAGVSDLSLRSSARSDLPPFIKVQSADVRLRWLPLLAGKISIKSVHLEGVVIEIVRETDSQDNLPTLPGKTASPTNRSFLISALQAYKGSLKYEDRQRSVKLDLPAWNLDLKGDASTLNHSFSFGIGVPGSLTNRNQSFPIASFQIEGVLRNDGLDVRRLQLNSEESSLRLSGKITNYSNPSLRFEVDATIDAGRAMRFAGLQLDAGGKLTAKSSILGPMDNLQIATHLESANLWFRGYRQVEIGADIQWKQQANRLQIENLRIHSPLGEINAKADLALAKDAGKSQLAAKIDRLDVLSICRRQSLPLQIASIAKADAVLEWPGMAFQEVQGLANIRLLPRRAALSRKLLPVSMALSLKAKNDRIQADIGSLDAMNSHWEGQVSLEPLKKLGGRIAGRIAGHITGHITGKMSRLDALPASLSAFLGREAESALPRIAGELDVSVALSGTLDRPVFSSTLESSNLSLGMLSGLSVTSHVQYEAEQIRVADARLSWQGQTVSATGSIGLQGSSPSLNLTAEAAKISLEAVVAGLGQQIPIAGILNFKSHVGGTLEKIEAEAVAAASGLKAYGELFGDLSVNAQMEGDKIRVTSLELDKPSSTGRNGHLKAGGSLDLASKTYDFEAETSDLILTSLNLPDDIPVQGEIHFTARGRGALDNASLDAQLDARDLIIGLQRLGAVTAKANLAQRQVNVQVGIPWLGVQSTALIQIDAPYRMQFETTVAGADLSRLNIQEHEGQPLKGTLTARLRGAGNMVDWKSGQADLQVSELLVNLAGQSLHNEGPIEIDYKDETISVRSAALAMGSLRLSLSGAMPMTLSHGEGSLAAAGSMDLGELMTLVPGASSITASGALELSAAAHGAFESIVPSVRLSLKDGFIRHPDLLFPIEKIGLDIRYDKGEIALHALSAAFGAATLQAGATAPLSVLPIKPPASLASKEGPAKFEVDLRNLQLLNFKAPDNIEGALSVHMKGELANAADLTSLNAQITIPDLRFKTESLEIQQSAPSRILIRDGVAFIDRFSLTGPVSTIEASGQAQLAGKRLIDARINGTADLGILSLFATQVKAQGRTQFQVALGGEMASPQFSGTVSVEDGQLASSSPQALVDNLDVRMDLKPGRIQIAKLSGSLNGGSLEANGWIGYHGLALDDINVEVSTDGAFLEFPKGLKTQLQGNLHMRSRENLVILGGQVNILEGSYRDRIDLQGELFQYLESGGNTMLIEERNPFLSRIRYDLPLATLGPVVIDNNMAKLTMDAALRLVGSYYQPGFTGRITLEEGGEIYLNERKYYLERGNISFNNETRIAPELDVVARTNVGGYDVNLSIGGPAQRITASFTAEDSSGNFLSEPDIISLLLTGRTLDKVRGSEVNVAKEQALSYLAGNVGGRLTGSLQETLGLSQLRIDPALISPESNPGARLTIGEDITRFLKLTYSINLVDSEDQIYTVELNPIRKFVVRSTRQADNAYRFDFSHDLPFGAAGKTKSLSAAVRIVKKVRGVSFQGQTVFSSKILNSRFKIAAGDKYDFFKAQKGVDRLREYYNGQERLEARIRLNRAVKDAAVDLTLNIDAGPRIEFAYEGFPVPGSVKSHISRIWGEGVFDEQRISDCIETLRTFLIVDGYLQATATHEIQALADDKKQVIFRISPGVRFRNVALEFPGASSIAPAELNEVLRIEKLTTRIYTKPGDAAVVLTRYYRQKGFLEAKVDNPQYELDVQKQSGRVLLPVREGPRFRIGALKFQGNQAFQSSELAGAILVSPGTNYSPDLVQNSNSRLQSLYWSKGYNDVIIDHILRSTPQSALVDLDFNIIENKQSVVGKIAVEGNSETSKKFVKSQMAVAPGDVFASEKASVARKNLYDTGAYNLVSIETRPLDPGTEIKGVQKALEVVATVREVKPWQLNYGGFYDTERGPGFIADLVNRNSLGSARVLGVRARYDADLHEFRGYFSQPLLRRFPLKTNATVYTQKELFEDFITDRLGFSIQEELHLKNKLTLAAGYQYERTHTYDKDPESLFQVPPVKIAPLIMSLTRDSRDDFLNATHGSFMSHALQYAPSLLGSDLRYVKYFGQYFKYLPLSGPTDVAFSAKKRSRLVYAGAIRIGLAKGLGGQDVIYSERFFAGGGTTIRGFKQQGVGPIDFLGDAAGGNALFILNNELRFPVFQMFDGAGFLDIGNVYSKVSDFNPFKVRKSAGLGLRVHTPYFLLRLDYGFNLQRQPGESPGKFFFSIGQAF